MDDFELYLDTADIDAIKDLDQILNVQGVTTNPSILAKTGEDPLVAVQKIIDYFTPEQKIFMQVVSTDLQGILDEAHFIASLRPKNMCPKIPVSHNGLRAIKQLESEGIQCLATSIYSADAGFMAAHNGACKTCATWWTCSRCRTPRRRCLAPRSRTRTRCTR